MKFFLKYKFLLVSFSIVIISFFGLYFMLDLPLLYGTDLRPQWFPFYEQFRQMIHNFIIERQLPFYAWDLFLGTDFFSSKSYYIMGDIFSYVGLLLNDNFFDTAMVINIVKFVVSIVSMNLLLKKFKFNINTRTVGCLLYTFSGWAIFFSGQLSFLSFYVLMPFYFVGIENYVQNRKYGIFVFSSSLLLFTNFYFFFTLSLLTPLYYIYRYYCIHKGFSSFIKNTIILIAYYLLSVSITAVMTLPTLLTIINNDRLGKSFNIFYELKVYFHYIFSVLIPNYLYIYRDNIFDTTNHFSREICLYSTSLIPLLLPQLFFEKKSIYKKTSLILFYTLILFLIFPFFGYVLHGFSDPSLRWSFFIILFNVIVICRYLENPDLINYRILNKTMISIIVLLILIIPVYSFIGNYDMKLYINQYYICLIFILLYFLMYFLLRYKHNIYCIMLLVIVEISASGFCLYSGMLEVSKFENNKYINDVTSVLQTDKGELNRYLNYLDDNKGYSQYYRVYIDQKELYWDYSHNMSLFYDINGLMTYDSTYENSINNLKDIGNITDYDSEWIFDIKDSDLINFLSTKFAIVIDKGSLPQGVKWRLVESNYNGLKIYINEDYRSAGNSYAKCEQIDKLTSYDQLNSSVFYYDKCDLLQIKENASDVALENITYSNNSFYGTVTTETENYMVLSIPYNKGWNIQINGNKATFQKVNGGFIGFKIEKGFNEISMTFIPYGFKIGVILSCLGLFIFIVLLLVSKYNSPKKRGNKYGKN